MAVSEDATIINKYGFHVRPSTSFSQLAKTFPCDVMVSAGGPAVDGKSPMTLMTLGATQGAVITITCDGEKEADALAALKDHVDASFGGIE